MTDPAIFDRLGTANGIVILDGDIVVNVGAAQKLASIFFSKQVDESLLHVAFDGKFEGRDDLQLSSSFDVGGQTLDGGKVNLILDGPAAGAAMPVRLFAYGEDVPAGMVEIAVWVTNEEASGQPMLVRNGSALLITELKR